MFSMWLSVVYACAALLSAQASPKVQVLRSIPSTVSDISLLIPMSVSHHQQHKVESDSDQEPDLGEPFSNIPSYAFTLDSDPSTIVNRAEDQKPKPSRSVYLTGIWQRALDKDARGDRENPESGNDFSKLDTLTDKKQRACLALANEHSGSAREVMLYLCSELIEVLKSRCCCCEERQGVKESKSNHSYTMPWFGAINLRRNKESSLNEGSSDNR